MLSYSVEIWVLTKKDKRRVQAAEIRILSSIEGKTRRDRIRNIEIRERLDIRPLQEYIKNKRGYSGSDLLSEWH